MLRKIFPEAYYSADSGTKRGPLSLFTFLFVTFFASMSVDWLFNEIYMREPVLKFPLSVIGWAIFIVLVVRPVIGFVIYYLLKKKIIK